VIAATIWAPELDVPTSKPMSPDPITGAVIHTISMAVMMVLAGWVNSPIAELSPAEVLTVTPEAYPTPFPRTTLVV
jgi:predicted anti-sigma-YlaC factor YlaD